MVEYVAAEEAGILQSQDICHENAGVGGIRNSAYKRGKTQQPSRHLGEHVVCGRFIALSTVLLVWREEEMTRSSCSHKVVCGQGMRRAEGKDFGGGKCMFC